MSRPTISRDSKPVAVDTAEVVIDSAVRGATWGAVAGLIFPKTLGGPLRHARIVAAGLGAGNGLGFAMKKVQGREDAQSGMARGFGYAAASSKALGNCGPVAVMHGLFFGLALGALFQCVEIGTKTRHSESD